MATGEIKPGDKFNNYTVIEFAGRGTRSKLMYKCKCICGVVRNVVKGNLGIAMGCGCVRKSYRPRVRRILPPSRIVKTEALEIEPFNDDNEIETGPYIEPEKSVAQRIEAKLEEKRLKAELEEWF